jgi:2'-5' RNA ligase
MKTIRTFIAAQLDENVHQQLSAIQDQLKRANADVKWTAPEHIHLTLQFLGDTLVKKIKPITDALPEMLKDIPAFPMTVTHLGGFPDLKKPRVIWAGLDEEAQQNATILTKKIETGLNQLGFPKEKRPYSAHLTLGRVRSQRNGKKLLQQLSSLTIQPPIHQTIRTISFFQSTLTSAGPHYEILTTCHLE